MNYTYPSPLGDIFIAYNNYYIKALLFDVTEDSDVDSPPNPIITQCIKELDAYFAGELFEFTVPFDYGGTPFQRSVWEAIASIPFGQVVTYGDIGRQIGNGSAYRAIGNATGRNPISIILPCHRVVAVGGLGGYAGGIWRKEWLLEHEKNVDIKRKK